MASEREAPVRERAEQKIREIIESMRSEGPRYKSHDLGYVDSVSAFLVDEWADEIEQALSALPPVRAQEPTDHEEWAAFLSAWVDYNCGSDKSELAWREYQDHLHRTPPVAGCRCKVCAAALPPVPETPGDGMGTLKPRCDECWRRISMKAIDGWWVCTACQRRVVKSTKAAESRRRRKASGSSAATKGRQA